MQETKLPFSDSSSDADASNELATNQMPEDQSAKSAKQLMIDSEGVASEAPQQVLSTPLKSFLNSENASQFKEANMS